MAGDDYLAAIELRPIQTDSPSGTTPMEIDAYRLAQRYVGIHELDDHENHPLIAWWLSLCFDGKLDVPDTTPWCSAFVNGIAWELRLPRSQSAMARSWLKVGIPVALADARVGYDVVILWRGNKDLPSGHVGFYAGTEDGQILVLGGNQGDAVSVASFPVARLLGVRRLS